MLAILGHLPRDNGNIIFWHHNPQGFTRDYDFKVHTEGDKRIIEQIAVVDNFYDDNNKALLQYLQLHRKHRERKLYVVHTSRPELDIIYES